MAKSKASIEVDKAWKNIVTESSLTAGQYMIQNTGSADIRLYAKNTAPAVDVEGFQFLRPGWLRTIEITNGEGFWVRVYKGSSRLAILEL